MSDEEVAFNFLYLLLLFGLIYPPQEFCSAGKIRVKHQKSRKLILIAIF